MTLGAVPGFFSISLSVTKSDLGVKLDGCPLPGRMGFFLKGKNKNPVTFSGLIGTDSDFFKLVADVFPLWHCVNMHLNVPGSETTSYKLRIDQIINDTRRKMLHVVDLLRPK